MKSLALALPFLALVACTSTSRSSSDPAVRDASAAHFEHLKAMEGHWVGVGGDADGERASYRVTAGGSVVVETVFEGTDNEMVTTYHFDGDDLMLTHYCAAGNQPSMRALPGSETNHVVFECIGGTNMRESDGHMHRAEWEFVDRDHARSRWVFYTDGKPDHPYEMRLERR